MNFITPAYAQGAASGGDVFTSLIIPMMLMIAIFYFLIIRPQQTRAKQHRDLVDKVRRGDTVITAGGFVGRVTKVTEGADDIEVELAENWRVRVVKSTLMDVRSKGEPVKDTAS
ncbi:MAG: preprotein translocase subunit YajC [Hyphomicrobiaceae bacterium]|nr:preprotein translocase subunit YajC [Hyphomicrobiaceae bacterium]MCC0008734.1 preprotein translocase subunit YajC [Hyphomicrobiaceae bacterium]